MAIELGSLVLGWMYASKDGIAGLYQTGTRFRYKLLAHITDTNKEDTKSDLRSLQKPNLM